MVDEIRNGVDGWSLASYDWTDPKGKFRYERTLANGSVERATVTRHQPLSRHFPELNRRSKH